MQEETKKQVEEIKDPYHHKETYENWKKTKTIKGLNSRPNFLS